MLKHFKMLFFLMHNSERFVVGRRLSLVCPESFPLSHFRLLHVVQKRHWMEQSETWKS